LSRKKRRANCFALLIQFRTGDLDVFQIIRVDQVGNLAFPQFGVNFRYELVADVITEILDNPISSDCPGNEDTTGSKVQLGSLDAIHFGTRQQQDTDDRVSNDDVVLPYRNEHDCALLGWQLPD